MVAAARKIVISGYYGFRNSGDEAVLKSILTALEQEGKRAGVAFEPIVLSGDPSWTSGIYGVKAVHRMRMNEVRQALKESDGLISGGGSLLQDATSPKTIPYYVGVIRLAQWMGKPVFIYAQGVGPVNRKMFYPLIHGAFKRSHYISVRDQESAELLRSMKMDGGRIQVVPDPVMGMPLPAGAASKFPAEKPDGLPKIGVSVRFWNDERTELAGIADGLRQLAQRREVNFCFLPFHLPDDEEATNYVIERMGDVKSLGSKITKRQTEDPQSMLLEVGRCSALVGMRLHSLIYAAQQRVPVAGISYDPKIDNFLAQLDVKAIGSSDRMQPERLCEELERLLDGAEAWKAHREPMIAELQREAAKPARAIADYFASKG
ncbi:polysaccharide pyruvyl transferase CsaB [Saccharibacillus sp. CPCC 101409]|uniref:polysaccharide pyruvyl transferase CsaB n=1 Tax=Saccharibacillus sp. CPCC 101409 TaxID=3058041 RepID=UPI002672458B|nr:polysaccharide pyruvyl transferase CsaB [Saccharibacillus sp. CPCC 101409]MDO3412101.1 polysaccharide pyruvyl transferase CsaB [Saccharibacillus sp. CPCC 101409]